MGTGIVKLPITEYAQSVGAHLENLPKIVQITLLQFYFKFSHS